MQEQASNASSGISYNPKELVLIGFATVVVTLLWVSAFGKIFHPKREGLFIQNVITITFISQAREDLLQISQSAKTTMDWTKKTVSYQIEAVSQSFSLPSQSFFSSLPTFIPQVELAYKQLLHADLFSASRQTFLAIGFDQSQKTAVLPARAFPNQLEAFSSLADLLGFVDNMTFGAITVVAPDFMKGGEHD